MPWSRIRWLDAWTASRPPYLASRPPYLASRPPDLASRPAPFGGAATPDFYGRAIKIFYLVDWQYKQQVIGNSVKLLFIAAAYLPQFQRPSARRKQ
jgi:hypothetical protein